MKQALTSVIISSYNYGRFLKEAVVSVKGQTHKAIECIIVDDCSTDNSASILDDIEIEWPDIIVVRSIANEGQSAAILKGLSLARGEFVLLLDADDVLLPDCVVSHLAVHYSSSIAVGFTCCDSLQIVNDVLVGARNGDLAKAFMNLPPTERLVSPAPLRRLAEEGLVLPFLPAESLRYVRWDSMDWPWSTTTCMFFKKSVLDLICGAAELRLMRLGTDNYLARVANLLTGSIIMDMQLAKYRIHGANGFSKRLHLNGLISHGRGDDYDAQTRQILLADIDKRFCNFFEVIDSPLRLVPILALLNFWYRTSDNKNESHLTAEAIVGSNREKWAALLGADLFEKLEEAAKEVDDPLKFVLEYFGESNAVEADALSSKLDEILDTTHKSLAVLSSPIEEAVLSSSTIQSIAMEVRFERQRTMLPYKVGKWLENIFK